MVEAIRNGSSPRKDVVRGGVEILGGSSEQTFEGLPNLEAVWYL